MRFLYTLLILVLLNQGLLGQKKAQVSFENWLSLEQVSAPVISSDGKNKAFSVTHTNWQNNSYDNEIWVKEGDKEAHQLTRTPKGGSNRAQFFPGGNWISFLADRGNKNQVYLIPVSGGEALQVTYEEEGVKDYSWSRDGKNLAFIKDMPESSSEKGTHKRYGSYDIEDSTFTYSHLWVMSFGLDSFYN